VIWKEEEEEEEEDGETLSLSFSGPAHFIILRPCPLCRLLPTPAFKKQREPPSAKL
jgi:hypothetical protein